MQISPSIKEVFLFFNFENRSLFIGFWFYAGGCVERGKLASEITRNEVSPWFMRRSDVLIKSLSVVQTFKMATWVAAASHMPFQALPVVEAGTFYF